MTFDRPRPASIPDAPGSYQFYDSDGRVIYVGKAKSLRSRLSSYFVSPERLAPKTAQMMECATRVEWIQVRSEAEALLVEYSLIKVHRPRFNVAMVDDKSYPWIALTMPEQWPRLSVTRGRLVKGVRYFGPYVNVGVIRETLDLLVRAYPVRTCTNGKFRRYERLGRPCLLYHIEKCSAPCAGYVDREEYEACMKGISAFLSGDSRGLAAKLGSDMEDAAAALEFERAARLRDHIELVRKAVEGRHVAGRGDESMDVVGIEDGVIEASVFVLCVRHGMIVGRRAFVIDKVEEIEDGPALVEKALELLYLLAGRATEAELGGAGMPREVVVSCLPGSPDVYETMLAQVAGTGAVGGRIRLKVPLRGRRRALLDQARENAAQELARHRMRRASDLASRQAAIGQLQSLLGMARAPLRIECYDTSHLQGHEYVASMVVLEDGLPRPSEYRRFRLRDVPGNDDFAAMEEVLRRRLGRLLEDREASRPAPGVEGDAARQERVVGDSGKSKKFSYPPHLLLLDGGKGQLGVGVRVLTELGLEGEIYVAALAKKQEEVFVPGRPDPVEMDRGSDALFLLQRARDEAHRFAIGYHRKLHRKAAVTGRLDGVAGLGPARSRRLLKEHGSLKALRELTLDDLTAISWLPDKVAAGVFDVLHK